MKVLAKTDVDGILHLTPGNQYEVIGIEGTWLRIINDRGEPILYPPEAFDVTETRAPEDWIWDWYSADEYYANPAVFNARGFYERYFDGNQDAKDVFLNYVRQLKQSVDDS